MEGSENISLSLDLHLGWPLLGQLTFESALRVSVVTLGEYKIRCALEIARFNKVGIGGGLRRTF